MRFPDDLLSWLHDVQREETSLDRARRAAQANPTDMQPRYALARALANTGHFEDATTEYVWLWQHMLEHEPAKVGVEGSFMLGEIARLMSEHPPARKRFDNLRDTVLGDAPPANVTGRVVLDWIDLSVALGEADRVLGWFDANSAVLHAAPALEGTLQRGVLPLLIERGRWADVRRCFEDPLASLRKGHGRLTALRNEPLEPHLAERGPVAIEAQRLSTSRSRHAPT